MTLLRRILRGLGWGATGLLSVAFLIGYAAPYLPPAQFWWTDLFAVLLPPMGLAVGLLGLGVLGQGVYRRRWGRVVVAGALLGLVGLRFGPRVPGVDTSAADATTLRVMTFNVPMSLARQEASARALGRFVQQESPDVLAFQEARMARGTSSWASRDGPSWPPRRILEDSLGYTPPHRRPSQTTICQPVLGRSLLDSIIVRPLPPDGDADRCSQYTRAEFTWQNQSAVLYNVHLHTIGSVRPSSLVEKWASLGRWRAFLRTYREGALHRARQARLIRRRLEQEEHPVLVVGDFNSTPHQWAYRHIATGLQGAGTGGTFPARRPLVRIDHILAGPAWEVVSARVPSPNEDVPISDHRPVAVQLRWGADYSE